MRLEFGIRYANGQCNINEKYGITKNHLKIILAAAKIYLSIPPPTKMTIIHMNPIRKVNKSELCVILIISFLFNISCHRIAGHGQVFGPVMRPFFFFNFALPSDLRKQFGFSPALFPIYVKASQPVVS